MTVSQDLYIQVSTTPKRILKKDPKRQAWHITNIGSVTVYYLRGETGNKVSISGDTVGIPIIAANFDGYQEFESQDELWVAAASLTPIILGVNTEQRGD